MNDNFECSDAGLQAVVPPFAQHLPVSMNSVLFACESGSRMWGAAAADSDYDVRIIYKQPHWKYLRLREPRDNFEVSVPSLDLDIAGWDAKKTLNLARKSNPSLLEWLQSPIIYLEVTGWVRQLRDVMKDFSPRAAMHHYASMAGTQAKIYWKPDQPVRLKKYVYLVRPLVCLMWMRANDYRMPPMDWNVLLSETPEMPQGVKTECGIINERRAAEGDQALGRLPAIDRFIELRLAEAHRFADEAPSREPDPEALQELFDWTMQ